jgi:hypothetical protein
LENRVNGRGEDLKVPGVIAPAQVRYAALIQALGPEVDAVAKDLEVYAGSSIPDEYSVETEVEGISRAADEAGFDRFHLSGRATSVANSDKTPLLLRMSNRWVAQTGVIHLC